MEREFRLRGLNSGLGLDRVGGAAAAADCVDTGDARLGALGADTDEGAAALAASIPGSDTCEAPGEGCDGCINRVGGGSRAFDEADEAPGFSVG